jgi:hypothetical protein
MRQRRRVHLKADPGDAAQRVAPPTSHLLSASDRALVHGFRSLHSRSQLRNGSYREQPLAILRCSYFSTGRRDKTAALTVDHHTIAAIALTGTALNLLGGLYLAYDLFGGKHGPLRTLTRAVTYGVLFFLGYVVFLPVSFSVIAALGTGSTLAIEFARAARGARPSRTVEAISSIVRGACFGLGSAWLFGWRFGVSFGVLSTIGQIVAYRMGISPTLGLDARRQRRKHLLGVANRTIGYALAGLVSTAAAQEQSRTAVLFGVGMGVAIGAISALMGVMGPVIEQWADRLPVRRLGVFGTLLIVSGFLLESVERWLVLFDVPIR